MATAYKILGQSAPANTSTLTCTQYPHQPQQLFQQLLLLTQRQPSLTLRFIFARQERQRLLATLLFIRKRFLLTALLPTPMVLLWLRRT